MIRVLSVLALLPACAIDYPPEPFEVADTTVARCAPTTATYPVTISGTVVDFATHEPLAGVPIDIGRAWVNGQRFPADTCALASTVSGSDGSFGPLVIQVPGSYPGVFSDQFLVFLAQADGLAPLASDNRIHCDFDPDSCEVLDHVLPVPPVELANSWRKEMRRGGMDHTWTRGMIVFEFRDTSAQPAVNVKPRRSAIFTDDYQLDPGTEVRFFDDRTRLRPADATRTTSSGLALISPDYNPGATMEIVGESNVARWPSTGCLIGDGWIFVEDRQMSRQ